MKVLNIVGHCSREFSSFLGVHKQIAAAVSACGRVENFFVCGEEGSVPPHIAPGSWFGTSSFMGASFRVLRKKQRFSLRWLFLKQKKVGPI